MQLERFKQKPWPRVFAAAMVGVFLVALPPLGTLSYDLSQELKPPAAITNLALIFANEATVREFGDGRGNVARVHHTRLLNQLTQQGVKLAFFDFVFGETNPVPYADEALAAAIRRHGQVILVGEGKTWREAGAALEAVSPPADIFRRAARSWGHGEIFGDVARQIPPEIAGTPCAAWAAADVMVPGSPPLQIRKAVRWLNYYGYPDGEILPQYSFQEVLTNGLPALTLSNKIVFIGQQVSADKIASARDTFATPYFWQDRVSGACIHATAFLNLLHGDWLRQMPLLGQCLAAAIWGAIITLVLHELSRTRKLVLIVAAIGAAGALTAVCLYVQWHFFWWWSWLGPVLGQTTFALVLAVVSPKGNPYVAFISYRTQDDGSTALLLAERLSKRGFKTFIDKQSLNLGLFDDQLLRVIERSSYFVLIVSPNSLARCTEPGDWLLKELRHALKHGKTIIPVFKDNFSFKNEDAIPDIPELKHLARSQGLSFSTADVDGFVKMLVRRMDQFQDVQDQKAIISANSRQLS